MMLNHSSTDDLSWLSFHVCTFFFILLCSSAVSTLREKNLFLWHSLAWSLLHTHAHPYVHFDLWFVCLLFPSLCSPLQWSDQLILNLEALNCSLAKTPATSSRYVSSHLDVTVANVPMCGSIVSFPWFWFHFTLQKAAISAHSLSQTLVISWFSKKQP